MSSAFSILFVRSQSTILPPCNKDRKWHAKELGKEIAYSMPFMFSSAIKDIFHFAV
jgi:hypothetical protein